MQVVVEIMMGTIFHIQVGDDATVLDLKIAIHNQENVPVNRILLLLDIGDDHLLMNDDQKPLSEYSVQDGSRFQLIFKPFETEKDGDDTEAEKENDDAEKDDDDIEAEKDNDDAEAEKDNDDAEAEKDDAAAAAHYDTFAAAYAALVGSPLPDIADPGDDMSREDESNDNSSDDSGSTTPKTPHEESTAESPEYISISD
ncbi:histone chaperone ASF1 isoform X2 [Solanum lycopersicum]|uniref:histone chaperone ASF1 isoform X2 n=1 Tax=Solanum lycopersicum TaxID=4081 RepID=UPI003748C3AE